MGRTALLAVIAGAVVVVAALAAITPTVLVNDDHGRGVRVMRLAGPAGLRPAPFAKPGQGFAPRVRECRQRNG